MKDFSQAYSRYQRQLLAYAMSFLVKEEAEDVVQEVFSKMLSSDTTFSSQKELRNFLYVSVRNKCLDILKHKNVVRDFVSEVPQFMDTYMEEEMFAGEVYSRLFAHIDQLPVRQRDTLLQYCEGKNNAEIAMNMNVSVSTVKSQKYKAIIALREIMKNSEFMLLLTYALGALKCF